eukprot:2881255-Alexandrium_andersonii.AAC.1
MLEGGSPSLTPPKHDTTDGNVQQTEAFMGGPFLGKKQRTQTPEGSPALFLLGQKLTFIPAIKLKLNAEHTKAGPNSLQRSARMLKDRGTPKLIASELALIRLNLQSAPC